jgi:hypothetical protein
MRRLDELLDDKNVLAELTAAATEWLGRIRSDLEGAAPDEPIDPDVARMLAALLSREYEPTLERIIIDRLERPRVCVLEDVKHACLNHLMAWPPDPAAGMAAFRQFLLGVKAAERSSDPFPVFTGRLRFASIENRCFWNESPWFIWIVGALPASWEPVVEAPETIYAAVQGSCSPAALSALVSEVQPVLTSLFTTCSLLLGEEYFESVNLPDRLPGCLERGGPLQAENLTDDSGPPPCFWLIPKCLKAYFANPTKKDSIDRRIRNAVHLLAESDRQQHHGVALTLSVAAMEALVSRKGEAIASLLADAVATMLEPNPGKRTDAVEFAKSLYDARSQVLHGSAIEAEHDRRDEARLLASALLQAMLQRREMMRRLGSDPDTPEKLLEEIKGLKFSSGLPAGVTESPARKLWTAEPGEGGLHDFGTKGK